MIALGLELSGSVVSGRLDILAVGPEGGRFAELRDCFFPVVMGRLLLSVIVVVLKRRTDHGVHAGHFGSERDIGTQRVDGLIVMRFCDRHLRVHDGGIQFPLLGGDLALETNQRRIVWPHFQQTLYVHLGSRQLRISGGMVLQGFSVRLQPCLIRSRQVVQFLR